MKEMDVEVVSGPNTSLGDDGRHLVDHKQEKIEATSSFGGEENEEQMKEDVQRLREMLETSTESKDLVRPKDLESSSLRRFIRARDHDVRAAFEQAVNILKWRKEHKLDLIIKRDYEFVAQDRWGMAYWHGKDVVGRPILVIRGCRHDPTLFTTETTLRYLIWKLETKLYDSSVDDVVVIFDFLNLSRHNLDMKLVRIMIPLLLNFYPERLGVCLVYPTSQIMWVLWKMVSKAFDEKTEKKFVFVREQKRDNKFLKLIPVDQLQERFGGTSKKEYGVDGLSLVPPDVQNKQNGDGSHHHLDDHVGDKNKVDEQQQPQQAQEQGNDDGEECFGPRAYASLSMSAADLDTEHAMRTHRGSIFDEDDEFKTFLNEREQEVDRFQLRLRYNVSNVRVDHGGRDADDLDSSSSSGGGGGVIPSPRSDVGDILDGKHRRGAYRPTSASEAGSSSSRRRGKRERVKRFLKRHILRQKSELGGSSPATTDNEEDEELTMDVQDRGKLGPIEVKRAADDVQVAHSIGPLAQDLEGSVNGSTHVLRRSLSSPKPSSPRGSQARFSLRSPKSRRKMYKGMFSESSISILDKVKFVMEAGASMRKVDRDDPSREFNTWSTCSPERYETRIGPDYKKNKLKAPSGASLYDTVCCDVWQLQSKRPHIASYMQLPNLSSSTATVDGEVAPLPELLIVNMLMPGYPPSGPFSKKRIDGPGYSIVLFSKLSAFAKNNPNDPAVQLFSRFVHAHDGDPFRERLKMITRLENPEEINMGRIEKALLAKYNGTPWLVRPEYEFHKGPGYFEIDIDYHLFKYFVLSNALPILERVHNSILDCALIIQAEKDQEMPERVLVSATIRCLNLQEAPEIDLVLLDKSKVRQSLNKLGASFIDRDGAVHQIKPKSDKPMPTVAEETKKKHDSQQPHHQQQQNEGDDDQETVFDNTIESQRRNGGPTSISSKADRSKTTRVNPFVLNFFQTGLLVAVIVLLIAFFLPIK